MVSVEFEPVFFGVLAGPQNDARPLRGQDP